MYCRFCYIPWRCHDGQQYTNCKCQLVLGSGNLSNKIQRYSMGQCVWKPWRCTISMADGVVFRPWNSSTYLPSSQLDIFRLAWCLKCGVNKLVTTSRQPVTISDRHHALGLSVFPRIMIGLSLFQTAASLELVYYKLG